MAILFQLKFGPLMQIPPTKSRMRLHNDDGRRLYLTPSERERFISCANKCPPERQTFCLTLAYTGCRLSEACQLGQHNLMLAELLMSIRTLKQRETVKVREIPIPECFARVLYETHCINLTAADQYLWGEGNRPLPRISAYRWVKEVMADAGVVGVHASPKGLRHGYGIHATRCGVQLHMLQKWMGHARMETTAIYATAVGPEEQEIASRMWTPQPDRAAHPFSP